MDGAFYLSPQQRPLLQRLLRRLFPAAALPMLEDEPGSVTTETSACLDWRDRLRVLVSGRVHLSTRAYTELPAGRVLRTHVAFHVPPPGSEV